MIMLFDFIPESYKKIKFACDVEEALVYSLQHFEKALLYSDRQTHLHLMRRLGNVCNELGVMYMNQAGSK